MFFPQKVAITSVGVGAEMFCAAVQFISAGLDRGFCVSRMSYVAKSKLLEEIIVQLRRKGLEIPDEVLSDLKAARALMNIAQADSGGMGETAPRIEEYLGNVEGYVLAEAERWFAPEQVSCWLEALAVASCMACVPSQKQEEERMRMVPGVPRDQKWVRVEPIAGLPVEKLERLASEMGLGFRRESSGRLVVYGSDEAVKGFIRRVSKHTS
jgi:hypothetical protein